MVKEMQQYQEKWQQHVQRIEYQNEPCNISQKDYGT